MIEQEVEEQSKWLTTGSFGQLLEKQLEKSSHEGYMKVY